MMPDNIGAGESYPTDDPRTWAVEEEAVCSEDRMMLYLTACMKANIWLNQAARGEIPHD